MVGRLKVFFSADQDMLDSRTFVNVVEGKELAILPDDFLWAGIENIAKLTELFL